MKIVKYSSDRKNEWDNFVCKAKNTHFMFYRDYIEYHKDRFEDFSLLIYDDNKLVSLFPANIKDNIIYSHGGLTFGSFLTDKSMNTVTMMKIFKDVINYYRNQNVKEIIYKCIPYIYCAIPAEEDKYALFVNDASLWRRDVSACINLRKEYKYYKGRKWMVSKAKKFSIDIFESVDYSLFWNILTENLINKYKTKPVHTIEEITLLHSLFPENIKLFVAKYQGEIVAGIVLYINPQIVHCQYIAANEKGKEIGALDLLIDYLINYYKDEKLYFDFGISNENDGKYLNEGLIQFKEGFGARAVCHDFYRIEIG